MFFLNVYTEATACQMGEHMEYMI